MIPPTSPSFEEALKWLSSFTDYEQLRNQTPVRTTFDLGRLERLLDRLGSPHRGRPVVHITGTKGKSSVTTLVDALLHAHGLKTFRFLSPHVETLQERLAVDGQNVRDDQFVALVHELRPVVEELRRTAPEDLPSFFEAMTVLGFLSAARENVQALVLEVGLGGRLDATNVVDPTVAVITSIALDHTRVLGSTVEEIAWEKAGILKPGRPALLGFGPEHRAFPVIAARARELACPLHYPGHGLGVTEWRNASDPKIGALTEWSGWLGSMRWESLQVSGGGGHHAMNAVLALGATQRVLESRGQELDLALCRSTLRHARVLGRAEWFPSPAPPVLLDGAHTAESVAALVPVATSLAAGRPLHAVLGLTRDRDPKAVFAALVPHLASLTATRLATPRSLEPDNITAALAGGPCAVDSKDDPLLALRHAEERAGDSGVVLVTGSLYLVGALLPRVRGRTEPGSD